MSEEHVAAARAEWHDLLLHLAGWLADDDLVKARALLAAGRLDEVAEVVARAIATGLVPYSRQDADRLRALLAGHHDDDPSLVDGGVRQEMEDPPYEFASVSPWTIGPAVVDDVDHAAVEAAADAPVTRLWRAWRYPPTGLQSPCRVYLAETPVDADPAEVTGRLQEALGRAGEPAPQVEAYVAGALLPHYQRSALAAAEALPIDRSS
jgi:hypothetical protein